MTKIIVHGLAEAARIPDNRQMLVACCFWLSVLSNPEDHDNQKDEYLI